MARGAPDFGAVAPRALTTPVLDLGEAVVRLGSPVSFDRRGTVIAIFAGTQLGYDHISAAGTTKRFDISPQRTLDGGYSMRIETASADAVVTVTIDVPFLGSGGTAVEAVWNRDTAIDGQVALRTIAGDGTTQTTSGIQWDDPTRRWQYIDTTGAWVDSPAQPDAPFPNGWVSMKVAIDTPTGLYLFGGVNGEDMGLRDIATRRISSPERFLRGLFELTADDGASAVVHLNHVIFTVNEI